jgi:hypothetical protein
MKRTRFTEEQIIGIRKAQPRGGEPIAQSLVGTGGRFTIEHQAEALIAAGIPAQDGVDLASAAQPESPCGRRSSSPARSDLSASCLHSADALSP